MIRATQRPPPKGPCPVHAAGAAARRHPGRSRAELRLRVSSQAVQTTFIPEGVMHARSTERLAGGLFVAGGVMFCVAAVLADQLASCGVAGAFFGLGGLRLMRSRLAR